MTTTTNGLNRRFFNLGQELSPETDYLWLIISGIVKTYTRNSVGMPITLGFWGSKDIVGNSLSTIDPYLTKCLSDVKAIAIPRTEWSSLSRELLYCEQQTQQLLYIVRNVRVAKRLWLLLTWLADKFGRTVNHGRLIDFQLTHQELAEALGTTRITITKTLNEFEQEGLILRPKTRCIILKTVKI